MHHILVEFAVFHIIFWWKYIGLSPCFENISFAKSGFCIRSRKTFLGWWLFLGEKRDVFISSTSDWFLIKAQSLPELPDRSLRSSRPNGLDSAATVDWAARCVPQKSSMTQGERESRKKQGRREPNSRKDRWHRGSQNWYGRPEGANHCLFATDWTDRLRFLSASALPCIRNFFHLVARII